MQDKLLNARDVIWGKCSNGIYDNFFFGQGIWTFGFIRELIYYNIFAIILEEGLFFCSIIWVMVFVLSTIIKNRDEHTSIFLIFY